MNQGFSKDFYRKGNSVKRSRRFSEPPHSIPLKCFVKDKLRLHFRWGVLITVLCAYLWRAAAAAMPPVPCKGFAIRPLRAVSAECACDT